MSRPTRVVTGWELRELWIGGRGPILAIGVAALLSAITYVTASSGSLNLLDHRETVFLVTQISVAVPALLALLAAADAISGERERGSLESLLLAPVLRRQIVIGKLAASQSLLVVALTLTLPYLWFLSRGLGLGLKLPIAVAVVGGLLGLTLACFGIIVSVFARSNRASLSISLFVLLAGFAPSQLPKTAATGWVGETLSRIDPLSAGLHYLRGMVLDGRSVTEEITWLISPAMTAVLFLGIAIAVADRFTLLGGGVSE